MDLGKKLKEVKPNYKFIIFRVITAILGIVLVSWLWISTAIESGGLPKDIPLVNIIILLVLFGVPTVLLVLWLIHNIKKLWYSLELYEKGILLNGKSYSFGEMGTFRFIKSQYNFLGMFYTPISYYELFTDLKKVQISDLDYDKAHKTFILTYDDLRFGGN